MVMHTIKEKFKLNMFFLTYLIHNIFVNTGIRIESVSHILITTLKKKCD